jgi:hypothetical protein
MGRTWTTALAVGAAVRRSNEALGLLAPVRGTGAAGWTAAQIADGAIGSAEIADGAVGAPEVADGAVGTAKLAPGAVDESRLAAGPLARYPLSAVVGVDGALVAGRGAVASTEVMNPGVYRVTFDRDVSRCAFSVQRLATAGETSALRPRAGDRPPRGDSRQRRRRREPGLRRHGRLLTRAGGRRPRRPGRYPR